MPVNGYLLAERILSVTNVTFRPATPAAVGAGAGTGCRAGLERRHAGANRRGPAPGAYRRGPAVRRMLLASYPRAEVADEGLFNALVDGSRLVVGQRVIRGLVSQGIG